MTEDSKSISTVEDAIEYPFVSLRSIRTYPFEEEQKGYERAFNDIMHHLLAGGFRKSTTAEA